MLKKIRIIVKSFLIEFPLHLNNLKNFLLSSLRINRNLTLFLLTLYHHCFYCYLYFIYTHLYNDSFHLLFKFKKILIKNQFFKIF